MTIRKAGLVLVFAGAGLTFAAESWAQQTKTRDQLIQDDRAYIASRENWIYNDVAKGFDAANETGKPLLVVFRCVPCKACAQLDESVIEADPQLQSLLEQYICVRVVRANGLDLRLFQFDYDQSFAAFIMNGDKTIYGRFGTRSHQTRSEEDVSLAGFVAALEAGLQIHAAFPSNKSELAGKQSRFEPPFSAPEQSSRLSKKYKSELDYEGKVAASCIHCHQVGEALISAMRDEQQPFSADALFPYPHPKILGLIMDPRHKSVVSNVMTDSSAERDGFRAGDDILSLDEQAVLSIADLQWALHGAGNRTSLGASIRRNGQPMQLSLTLTPGWRSKGDISWRATSWALRRMTTGGMLLKDARPESRAAKKLGDDSMAMEVGHLGEYGENAHAKQRGFKKGDVIISFAGEAKRMRETDLFAFLVNKPIGEKVPVRLLRGSEQLELDLKMQK